MHNTIQIEINENAKLKSVFPDGLIPNNSDIDKGKTGNGLTTAELLADRHSIIVNPQVNTIGDKQAFCTTEKINVHAIYTGEGKGIEEFLLSDLPKKKIFVTPESFPLIITAAIKSGLEQKLYNEFFCLLDESHCFASEKFRNGILRPFNHFFKFQNKAMGSATPFPYTDPRIVALQKYKIMYKDLLGKMSIIYGEKPQDILANMLQGWEFKGNVHIFFNTVTSCGNVVRTTGIKDFNIYCVDSERNKANLHEFGDKIIDRPIQGKYAKFNFYSCRYIEGWDMFDDEDTTMIFVTDVKVSHSIMNIGIKGVQSMGRLRNLKPLNAYHITNSFNKPDKYNKSIKQIQWQVEMEGREHVTYYNQYRKKALMEFRPISKRLLDLVGPFANIIDEWAEYCHMKSNQELYEEFTRNTYNNIDTIKECWVNARYETGVYLWELPTVEVKGKQQNEINREVHQLIMEYRNNLLQFSYGNAKKAFKTLKGKYSILFQAIDILNDTQLKETDYHNDKMKQALINQSNANQRGKLIVALIEEFKIGIRYSRKYIKNKLQELYKEFNIIGTNGRIKNAKATDLEDFELFHLKECKIDGDGGKRQQAFEIEAKKYLISIAA
ncbi:hypothetical protein ASE92_12520 [Pedobacter sp. Leaf41]|uniref:hypothetical protein n=1 Tax=Pedobacter sp. Leaf41 TaxID=1736218 RepID=UPI0007029AAE|nr:hypothetical protein [Pedobacter sp. Leaf41]KQN34416.1 hypothetical protein ASE92_12520 [Pedobacter sp. Leaf41]